MSNLGFMDLTDENTTNLAQQLPPSSAARTLPPSIVGINRLPAPSVPRSFVPPTMHGNIHQQYQNLQPQHRNHTVQQQMQQMQQAHQLSQQQQLHQQHYNNYIKYQRPQPPITPNNSQHLPPPYGQRQLPPSIVPHNGIARQQVSGVPNNGACLIFCILL